MNQKNNPSLCVICEAKDLGCPCFKVELFDKDCNVISENICKSEQKVYLSVPKKSEYMIRVKACKTEGAINPIGISRWLVLDPNKKCIQFFIFNNYCAFFYKRKVHVDFKVTDQYYPELPIPKGVLILWPNIQ